MFQLDCKLPADVTARVTSDREVAASAERNLLLEAYIPGIDVLTTPVSGPDIRIDHLESSERGLERNGLELTLKDTWNGELSPDVYHLMYAASRVRLMQEGLYSVHAASVGRHEQILLVGHSGSGKTTTALELIRSKGWKIASGNKTVVEFDGCGDMSIAAGTTTMTVRDGDQEKITESLAAEVISYGNRLAFALDDSHYVTLSRNKVAAIVLVRLHDGLRDAKELTGLSSLHTLYPYFMDAVNADVLVARGAGVFSGTAPTGASKQLGMQLGAAISRIPVYSVAGTSRFVVETIADIGSSLPRLG